MSGQNEQFDHFDYFVHFGYIYAMAIVSATHAKQNFAALLDQAQREPVRIQRHERDVAVLVSAEEYEKIHQLRVKELLRFTEEKSKYAEAQGMTDELLEQLLADGK
jgi:prevent-host-death family protein